MSEKTGGYLIVFEGIDGTGKTTQLALLADYLRSHGHDVIETREPTNGYYGKKIRLLYQDRQACTPEEELSLFLADRHDHVDRLIRPALAAGKTVLCDRYFLSTAAYQGAAGFDPQDIIEKNRFAPEPDLALVFELDVEKGVSRITDQRKESLNDFEQLDSLKKVDTFFRQMQLPYIRRIDASGSIEQIHLTVRSIVEDMLKEQQAVTDSK